MPRGKTGARLSPRHKLLAAEPFRPPKAPPPQAAWVPSHLDMWGNNQYGDCVSAEEAFAKATYLPEIFVDADTVVAWAQQRGFRDGADLSEVLDAMLSDGFRVGQQQYNDGKKLGVDYTNEDVLRAAIAMGAVKIAVDSNSLPSGAGNNQGWKAFGGEPGQFNSTDHCVALAGYGPASYCYDALKVSLPAGIDPAKPCYLLYTWSTIGVVDHDWILSTCAEAWIRQPTTVGVPPLPEPTPPQPTPTPTPTPSPAPTPPAPSPSPWWQFIVGLLPIILPIIIQLLQKLLPAAERARDQQLRR